MVNRAPADSGTGEIDPAVAALGVAALLGGMAYLASRSTSPLQQQGPGSPPAGADGGVTPPVVIDWDLSGASSTPPAIDVGPVGLNVNVHSAQGDFDGITVSVVGSMEDQRIPVEGWQDWPSTGAIQTQRSFTIHVDLNPYAWARFVFVALVLKRGQHEVLTGNPAYSYYHPYLLKKVAVRVPPGGTTAPPPAPQPTPNPVPPGPLPPAQGPPAPPQPAPQRSVNAGIGLDGFNWPGPWTVTPGQNLSGTIRLQNTGNVTTQYHVELIWQSDVLHDGTRYLSGDLSLAPGLSGDLPFHTPAPAIQGIYPPYLKVQTGDQVLIPNDHSFAAVYNLSVGPRSNQEPPAPLPPVAPAPPAPSQPPPQPLLGIQVLDFLGSSQHGPWTMQPSSALPIQIIFSNPGVAATAYQTHIVWTNPQAGDGSSYHETSFALNAGEHFIWSFTAIAPGREGTYPCYLKVWDRTSGQTILSDGAPQPPQANIVIVRPLTTTTPPQGPPLPSVPPSVPIAPQPNPGPRVMPNIAWDVAPQPIQIGQTALVGVSVLSPGSPPLDNIQIYATASGDPNTIPGGDGGWQLYGTLSSSGGQISFDTSPYYGHGNWLHVVLLLNAGGETMWSGSPQGVGPHGQWIAGLHKAVLLTGNSPAEAPGPPNTIRYVPLTGVNPPPSEEPMAGDIVWSTSPDAAVPAGGNVAVQVSVTPGTPQVDAIQIWVTASGDPNTIPGGDGGWNMTAGGNASQLSGGLYNVIETGFYGYPSGSWMHIAIIAFWSDGYVQSGTPQGGNFTPYLHKAIQLL